MNTNVVNTGKIVQVMGPVVDVVFENGDLPCIKDALEVTCEGKNLVMEVADAKTAADKLMDDARKEAAKEQEKTIKQAKDQIEELVVAATAKVVASGQGEAADRELYNQFLTKTGENK
jgi:F0F1-type ATP synthase beta subunit